MTVLLDHLAAGRIRPLIHDRLPLAEAGRAQALLESGQVIGKLLLKPRQRPGPICGRPPFRKDVAAR